MESFSCSTTEVHDIKALKIQGNSCKDRFEMSILKKAFVPVIGAAILSLASLKDGFAQTNGVADPQKASFAKNEVKPKALFTNNFESVTKDTTKAEPPSIYTLAEEYSKDLKGVGFAILKGTKDNRFTGDQIGNTILTKLKKENAEGQFFLKQGKGDNTSIVVFIEGHIQGEYGLHNILSNIPDIASIQKGGILTKQQAKSTAARSLDNN